MTGVGSNRPVRSNVAGHGIQVQQAAAATTVWQREGAEACWLESWLLGGSGMATGGGQRVKHHSLRLSGTNEIAKRVPEKKSFWISFEKRCTLLFLLSFSWKQHRSSLDTKSHRAPHEAYEARANAPLWTPPAGLAYTFLTPSLPDHPSARETAKKKSYAHAVSRSFAYETRRHHPGCVLRRAVSCEHHHHRGSSRRTPNRLLRSLLLPSITLPN